MVGNTKKERSNSAVFFEVLKQSICPLEFYSKTLFKRHQIPVCSSFLTASVYLCGNICSTASHVLPMFTWEPFNPEALREWDCIKIKYICAGLINLCRSSCGVKTLWSESVCMPYDFQGFAGNILSHSFLPLWHRGHVWAEDGLFQLLLWSIDVKIIK